MDHLRELKQFIIVVVGSIEKLSQPLTAFMSAWRRDGEFPTFTPVAAKLCECNLTQLQLFFFIGKQGNNFTVSSSSYYLESV